jgi:N-methylhydantoinase B/oxoprolinase/acetone carboxylase alpha subunit
VTSPVQVEVFRNLFASVCDEMGAVLRRSAYSPNIKERCDYSCALFDASGRLIAQGDHMPVHLGSMPASVRAILDSMRLAPGDVAAVNDPFRGGTHLPDLTMVAPFHGTATEAPLFYVANRAHHSDIGGMSPGSMPLASEIYQEGLRVPPVRLARSGAVDGDLLAMILANVRTPRERLGDLHAQMAALEVGGRRIGQMCARYGEPALQARAAELLDYAERGTRALLASIPEGVYEFEDALEDDGFGSGPLVIRARITLRDRSAVVDFTGTAAQTKGPVNAVEAITRSAVLYAFRCLLPGEVPANDGCLAPIRLVAPPGTIVNALPPAAVAAGNVETSQRIVDVVLGALARALPSRIPAASAGTMNNIAIGGVDPATGRAFAYYETLGGGMGGRPGSDGLDGVHTHMTNSLNTPIEAIEHDLPVVIRRYALRRGSGGGGLHRGGEGLVREYEFLSEAEVTVLAERRVLRPWGVGGGGPGAAGEETLVRRGLAPERMPGKFRVTVGAGDVLVVMTPGGGGWGKGGS